MSFRTWSRDVKNQKLQPVTKKECMNVFVLVRSDHVTLIPLTTSHDISHPEAPFVLEDLWVDQSPVIHRLRLRGTREGSMMARVRCKGCGLKLEHQHSMDTKGK